MTLIYLSSAWIAGIFLGSEIAFPPVIFFLGLLPLCFIPFLSQYRKVLLLAGLCLFIFFAGSFHFQSSLPVFDEQHLQSYNTQGTVEIMGAICNDPETGDKTSSFQISASELTIDGTSKEVTGKALIRVAVYPEYDYGDLLKVTGELETPSDIGDFDYRGYLARQEIYSIMYYPKIEVLDTGEGSKVLAWIYTLRDSLAQSLSSALPEPQSSLAQGIFLGLRDNITYTMKEAFSRTGTAHLLAISGLHLSIIIGILLSAGTWVFGRRYSIYILIAFLAIWLYVLVTGMRPPIVRGAIMGSLFLIAEYLGRQRSALTALTFAAALMIGIKPQILWDTSFQLSFLAMAGLISLFPHFQALGKRAVDAVISKEGTASSLANVVTDSFAVTLAAMLATFPVIAYSFGIVSFVGLPATFLALLALPGIIITAAIVSISGIFAPFPAQILGWIAWVFLSYLLAVVHIFDALPFSSAEVSNIQIWQILCYYGLLAMAVAAIKYRKQLSSLLPGRTSDTHRLTTSTSKLAFKLPVKWLLPSLVIATVLVWSAVFSMPDDKLHVSFLDVGQGDAILIQTPDHQDILIDGGPSPRAISLELGKKLPFWDKTIDLIVLTQPQADHVTGLVEILQNYNVKQVIEPSLALDSAIYRQWLSLIKEKESKYIKVGSGQEIDLGNGIILEVIHPPSPLLHGTSDDINNNGMVIRLSWKEVSFLLTADIAKEAEWNLIAQRAPLKSTVLKVAHHGSKTSTSPEFLAVVNPQVAVICAGKDNRFGHPHSEVTERLLERLGKDKVFITSDAGAIEFITDGERLWVKSNGSSP